jgi:hypothetical protein
MSIAPNRAVAVLTPVIFAPLAGSICVLAAKYVPGVDIDQGSVEAIFITGATIAFAKAGLWLKGWQDWEKREQASASMGAVAVDDPVDLDPDPQDVGDIVDEFVDEDDIIEDDVTDDVPVGAGV